MGNIKRVKGLLDGVITVMELVQNAFSWENKMLSAVSFVVRLLRTCSSSFNESLRLL